MLIFATGIVEHGIHGEILLVRARVQDGGLQLLILSLFILASAVKIISLDWYPMLRNMLLQTQDGKPKAKP